MQLRGSKSKENLGGYLCNVVSILDCSIRVNDCNYYCLHNYSYGLYTPSILNRYLLIKYICIAMVTMVYRTLHTQLYTNKHF